ncbi:MAG: YafY family protein [Verrucomicrobiota bacterium]
MGKETIHNLKRPAIERMLRIHNELKASSYPNCSTMAREMEVSAKTISRDIDFMRDRMLMPIEYDAALHGYYYTKEVQSLPTIDISEGELLALSIARKSLDHYKGTPFERPLQNALNKISANLPATITANLSDLSETISFKQSHLSNFDEHTLQTITKAVLDRKTVEFQYKKSGYTERESRRVNPYHLTNFHGKWYLLAHDHKRNAIRTFLLARASQPEIIDQSFSIPDDFTVDDYLWNGFGIWSKEGDMEVKISFEGPLAEHISENTWHPTQDVTRLPDGRIEVVFHLDALEEIANWTLNWGANAKVLSPRKLIELVKQNAQAVIDLYS